MVNQTEFWREVYKKSGRHRACGKPRLVPAFTIQALQENTVVIPPPKVDPYKEHRCGPSTFRKYYDRGLIPMTLESDGKGGTRVIWKKQCKIQKNAAESEPHQLDELNYHFYLPLLFDGLCETEKPYTTLVELGIASMLEGRRDRILNCIPELIMPMKKALDTKIPDILRRTMRVMQQLVRTGTCIGEALVLYFKQILPVFGLLKDRTVNYGEEIDYSQQRGENIQDIMQETLEVLELYGGEHAFVNIKYIVPTYESCMKN